MTVNLWDEVEKNLQGTKEQFQLLKEWSFKPIIIETDRLTVLCIIGQILLALKHPKNKGEPARISKLFLKILIQGLEDYSPIPEEVIYEWVKFGLFDPKEA